MSANKRAPAAACGAVCALVAACNAGDPAVATSRPVRLVELMATDQGYQPDRIYAEPGESLVVSVRNVSGTPQRLAFDFGAYGYGIERDTAPGGSARFRVEVPTRTGAYSFRTVSDAPGAIVSEGMLVVRAAPEVALEPVAAGLTEPVAMVPLPDGSRRFLVAERVGAVRLVNADGSLADQLALDLRNRIVDRDAEGDPRGLLGLALHPRFETNGRLFVYYTAPLGEAAPAHWDSTARLAEYNLAATTLPSARGERVILESHQPGRESLGGGLAFGPDGHLYVGLGDRGEAAAFEDRRSFANVVLRLDVDHGEPYAIPRDNPLGEVWAYGFRNPTHLGFDTGFDTGVEPALLVVDGGRGAWGEVDRVARGGDYGWPAQEGTRCVAPETPSETPKGQRGCAAGASRWPVVEVAGVAQEGGLGTIVGGYVYRGRALPDLGGYYVFGAQSARWNGRLYMARDPVASRDDLWPLEIVRVRTTADAAPGPRLVALARDDDGELYVLTDGGPDQPGPTGRIHRLAPAAR